VAPGVTEIEASEADDDDDQAAAQDGQTSDDDGEEASGNAIKVTHDTPRGSKGDGADQLIKTFGILAAAAFGADFSARSHLAHVPRGFAVLRAGDELSNRIKLMLPVQSWPQKYFDSLQTQITSLSIPFRPDGGRIAIVTDAGRNAMDADGAADDSAKSGRRSRVVLTPRRWRQVLEKQTSWGRRWQESPVTGESAK
jgi:hypothetical protein